MIKVTYKEAKDLIKKLEDEKNFRLIPWIEARDNNPFCIDDLETLLEKLDKIEEKIHAIDLALKNFDYNQEKLKKKQETLNKIEERFYYMRELHPYRIVLYKKIIKEEEKITAELNRPKEEDLIEIDIDINF